ncbi:MAG: hypothetical protein O3B01_11360 [Planctomycetota bacterium]|nr:hypothetical protein [Planctomycetota bacterium]
MRKSILLGIAGLALFPRAFAEKEKEGPPAYEFTGKLSEAGEDADFLGEGWNRRPGLVINDLRDAGHLYGQSEDMDEALEVLLGKMPEGSAAYAEFKYRSGQTTRYITLRVWVFEKTDRARFCWRGRYESPGWDRYYQKVDGVGDLAVDSKELKKRVVLAGNVIFACDEQPDGASYLKALDRYMTKMGAKKAE